MVIGAVLQLRFAKPFRVPGRLDDFGYALRDPKLVDRNLIALEAGHRKGIKFERSSWSGAADRTNAPETGRPSVNNGLEVGCGARRGGVAHAPAARAGRGAGDCASRQLLRARDRCPPRALPPMHRRCWRMPPVYILALHLRDSDIVLWSSLSWCLGVTYSVCRVVCVTMRMCSVLPAARSWPQCRRAMRSYVTPPTEVIIPASAPNRVCIWEHRHGGVCPVTIVAYLESLVAFGKQHPKLWRF